MILLALVVLVAMTLEDTFDTARILVVGRHWLLGSLLDSAEDLCQLLSVGIGGAELALHRLALGSLLIGLAIVVGSIAGGGAGHSLGGRIDRRRPAGDSAGITRGDT